MDKGKLKQAIIELVQEDKGFCETILAELRNTSTFVEVIRETNLTIEQERQTLNGIEDMRNM